MSRYPAITVPVTEFDRNEKPIIGTEYRRIWQSQFKAFLDEGWSVWHRPHSFRRAIVQFVLFGWLGPIACRAIYKA